MAKNVRGFDITINGELREIVFSYGMQEALTRIIRSPEVVGAVLLDPDARTAVLKELLAERKSNGKIITPVEDVYDLNFSGEEVEELLGWAAEHIMDFYLRSLLKVTQVGERMKEVNDKIAALSSSATGSEPSTSEKPSSGPSA